MCNGTLDATVGGGTLGYTFSWDGGPTPTLEDQATVCAGTYTLTVTDANGCTATTNSTITEPPLFTVTVTGTDASCNGVCDGTVSSVVAGGTGAITYAWDNGAGAAATATGLCANTYTLIVTDANGCTATDSYTVTEPVLLVVTIVGVNASCNGVCDGTATTTVTGGTGAVTYQWDDPTLSTTANLSGLCAGTFNVTITDVNGCSATNSVVITEPTPIVITVGSNDATCGAADGDVSSSATGGAGGYGFSWSDATPTVVGTIANVGSLPSGSYTVTVTDASGCSATAVAIINTTTGGTASAIVNNQVTCFGACDGQETATMTGGTAPFTFAWSDGQTTAIATGLCPGNYTVDVTDFNGCTSSAAITITEPPLLAVVITSQADPLCALSCDGTATATEVGGTGPTSYSWTTGGSALSETNMCAGTHTITVTDANGCVGTADVTLTDPAVLTAAIA
ncbi:MAG: SprB repeat-containing protein, partial [Flavobacteriales bacterium]|nr:SprB repeat-containing protein [Flavobacteriales bacterium]